MSPGEWKAGGEGLTHALRLPPLAVRHRAGDGDRRAGSPASPSPIPARRRPRSPTCSAAGRRRAMSRTPRAPRRWRSASSIPTLWRADQPLRVVLIGTDCEVRVWETLLKIPMGRATTYSDIARKVGTAEGGARGRRRGRQEPDLVRGAVPPRARQERQAHRLSLGPHPQARDARLGSRPRRRRVARRQLVPLHRAHGIACSRGLRSIRPHGARLQSRKTGDRRLMPASRLCEAAQFFCAGPVSEGTCGCSGGVP